MPEVPQNESTNPSKPESLNKPLKSTLNLPQTSFAMKANLPVNEPARLDAWQQMDLYGQIRKARAGAPKYVLHDGPPYANGAIHLGHALNKCLKDFIVKTRTMAGFDAPYIPGWDCHGLPIEVKVDEKLGRKKLEMDPIAVRQACRDYAQNFVNIQREQFIRLGVFGRWSQPYSTMSFLYEADILETFYGFFEKGFVYKGLKPVSWCIHDQTALAEAEVEYEQHTSPSVYVRYRLKSSPTDIDPALNGKRDVYTIIWTTTPWTLPASLAVAFHPEMEYVAIAASDAIYIVARALLAATVAATGLKNAAGHPITEADIVAQFPGAHMESLTFQHPFLDREILGVTADYVTAEQGTGAVHTAPAHGADDFATGKRYNLPEVQYVDNAGRQRNTGNFGGGGQPQPYEGLTVFKSNPVIIELLQEKGALLSATSFDHSYPHCWRCHNPVIVRATEQWFIDMETGMPRNAATTDDRGDEESFRQRALDAIKATRWDPAWGMERISNMVASRPDWCISRQRVWGVPIAVFLCNQCHEPLNNPAINASIVDIFRTHGADPWYVRDAASLLPTGTQCAGCGSSDFRKEMDILDVWFESGASWHAVLEREPELGLPCDLYAEGGDQHRGWFQSSLLNCVGLRGAAPYRMATTIGWTLDEQGRAMSKSLGNVVDPVDIAKRLGAEIVRLWVASVDFREDVAASENLMQRVSDNYRKLRNTFRFLLGNLHDFTPSTDAVRDAAKLEPLDQYILARLAEVDAKIRKAYDEFEFHRAYHALNEFTNTDLSALYLDVIKDRLYTFAPNAPARRSAQTALWHIAETLTRLVAPLLSFTADEVWQHLPQVEGREDSVHLATFGDLSEIVPGASKKLLDDWASLLEVRSAVLQSIEEARQSKTVGKALDARVNIVVTAPYTDTVDAYRGALPELFNVSQVRVFLEGTRLNEVSDWKSAKVETKAAAGTKCERCWRYTEDVASDKRWPTVCARCADALAAINYPPQESN